MRARRALRKPRGQVRLPAMEPPQLDLLKNEVTSLAKQKGLSVELSNELADALISRIARGQAGEPPVIEPGP